MPIRDEAINVFMGLPGRRRPPRADLQPRRRLLRARHRLQPHRDDRRGPRRHARAARRPGHRAREAAVPGARGRLADLLRARPGRLPAIELIERSLSRERDARRRERARAVIDLGSNSFRLVVFTWGEHGGHGWWQRTDEIHEAVRIGEGSTRPASCSPSRWSGRSRRSTCSPTSAARPASTTCGRSPPRRSATPRTRRTSCERRASARGCEIEVLAREEEARYGYLAAVNSTTLVRRRRARHRRRLDAARPTSPGRHARDARSWRLGAVRMTERFLAGEKRQAQAAQGAARARRRRARARPGWLNDAGADGARLAGIGGTVRNLAAAAEIAADLPSFGVQGFRARRARRSTTSSTRFADMSPDERGEVPGIKPERGDLILAGAFVVQTVMELGALRRARGHRGGAARGRLLLDAARGPRPAAVRGRAPRRGPQPRRAVRRRLRPHRARRAARARDVGRARRGRRAPLRPARARAAVGGGDAARHRHRGRLRRPPQALALPDPQRRAARLHARARPR